MRRHKVIWIGLALCLAAFIVLVFVRRFRPQRTPAADAQPRTLSFPSDRSLGTLFVRDWGTDKTWERLGEARGQVDVPGGQALMLQVELMAPRLPLWRRALARLGFRVGSTAVTRVDLSALRSLASNDLQELNLAGRNVTDKQLADIEHLTSLRELCLSGNPITDAGLYRVRRLTALKALNLRDTKITDEGMVWLRGMTVLEALDVAYTRVTEAGLDKLDCSRTLRKLWIENAAVSEEGFERLRQAFPRCRISD